MMNAVLLKRAMKYLDLSGVALAEKVSGLWEDGKRTAPETISRWLSGTRPVDPFLMGWLAELVRSKLMTQDDVSVRLPSEGLVIAVSNLKGGVGKTTVSRNLAVIAKSLRLKSTYIYADYPLSVRAGRTTKNRLEALRINCPELSLDEILAYKPVAGEIVIVDVSNGVARDSFFTPEKSEDRLQVNPTGFLGQFRPAIYVVPGEFSSSMDNWSLKAFIDSNVFHAPVQLLHRPSFMSMDFASTARADGFDVTSDMFCPFFIPQSVSASAVLPQDALSDWQNLDQKHHHYKLFEHLLELLGGGIMDSFDVMQSVKTAPLSKLLDLAEGVY